MFVTGILFDNLEATGLQPWLEYLGTFYNLRQSPFTKKDTKLYDYQEKLNVGSGAPLKYLELNASSKQATQTVDIEKSSGK